ncbi:FHA domain-containing protein [Corynebacterium hadale]|uniref:FHA domain-containing protein n=3 Tax=Corynebacterium TaxID=1716 RepID=A0A269PH30_9CORY|nr:MULTISPECIES: FHA domain-containing protein [Corynebacterium]MBL7284809.1 FHA domain-containing protein [Corynebacterium godavarianum]MCG7254291.1 FHA domain-containing protein [Corynebacterium hadale]MCG7257472.1 FHA domain-containing protein [Corynebacterium hadale]MCG7266018.1 FHA domain-containing protein [Corynebacterium hadale]PAJ71398.1 FHA domain-containing protein [Corynebacterium hadale]
MDSAVILSARFGLLALLWVFILLVLWVQRKDVVRAAGAVRRQAKSSAPIRREKARELAVVEGPLKGSHMEIASLEDLTIGRAGDNDFQLGDDFASSTHARLFRRGSEWFIEDMDSRNGTFVNGTRIDQPERVSVGTDIKMGRTIVRLMP